MEPGDFSVAPLENSLGRGEGSQLALTIDNRFGFRRGTSKLAPGVPGSLVGVRSTFDERPPDCLPPARMQDDSDSCASHPESSYQGFWPLYEPRLSMRSLPPERVRRHRRSISYELITCGGHERDAASPTP